MNTPLLEVESLVAGYGKVQVLRGVSLCVRSGSVTALLGSNGAGKTTLMRTLVGLVAHSSGKLLLDGADIGRTPSHRRVEAGIALVPEGRLIFPDLTVEENLRTGAVVRTARAGQSRASQRVYEMFPQLAERRTQLGHTLSGGEQQMLAIGRALMSSPRLLLLDEPSLGLAPKIVSLLFSTIQRVRADGLTVMIVEQNVGRTLDVSDYAYVMENGRVLMEGAAEQIRNSADIKSAYLGV